MIRYLVAISCAMASFSLTNCRSSLRTQSTSRNVNCYCMHKGNLLTRALHSQSFQAIQVLTCTVSLIYGHRCVNANMKPQFLLLTVHSQDPLEKYRTETITQLSNIYCNNKANDTNGGTWRQRDPASLGCSGPRAWAEGKKTPAIHLPHETPGNHRGRGVSSES